MHIASAGGIDRDATWRAVQNPHVVLGDNGMVCSVLASRPGTCGLLLRQHFWNATSPRWPHTADVVVGQHVRQAGLFAFFSLSFQYSSMSSGTKSWLNISPGVSSSLQCVLMDRTTA
jgi:hypothetical protein